MSSAVPAEALQSLLAWAQAERPHVALIMVSGFLSNAAKDFLADFERNNRPPFRIKYWEQPNIETLARENGELLQRFFASGTPFTPSDAEHIEQCETAGCRHPAVYVDPTDPADTAQGCALRAGRSPTSRRTSCSLALPSTPGAAAAPQTPGTNEERSWARCRYRGRRRRWRSRCQSMSWGDPAGGAPVFRAERVAGCWPGGYSSREETGAGPTWRPRGARCPGRPRTRATASFREGVPHR
jgi:hypothetical protein